MGARLSELLQAAGWWVRALQHRRPVLGADEVVAGDLMDVESLEVAVRGATAVLHLAAVTHSRRLALYKAVNVHGTRALLNAAEQAGVGRFVFVSSRTASDSGGAYAASKAIGERLVASAAIPHLTVRLPELYDGGGTEGVDAVIELVRRGRPVPLPGGGRDRVCPVLVDDALPALVMACGESTPTGREYTLAGECMTLRELVARSAAVLGSSSRPVSVPLAAVRALAALGRFLPLPIYPDQVARMKGPRHPPSSDADRVLGFKPRSLEAGLRLFDSA